MKFTAAIRELVENGTDGNYIVAKGTEGEHVRITKKGASLSARGARFHLARMTEKDYEAHLTKETLTFEEAIKAVPVEGRAVRAKSWSKDYEIRPNKHSGLTLYNAGEKSSVGINSADTNLEYEAVK